MKEMDGGYRQVGSCRICRSPELAGVLDLGTSPLANAFRTESELVEPETRFPLRLLLCLSCGLVQLSVVVDPHVLFERYLYSSSASAPMVEHFDLYAEALIERFTPSGSLVVEIGSNDGVLLRPLAGRGIRALGVEPSQNLSADANARGLETWNSFFTPSLAETIVRSKGQARAVLANNVLAHIDDLDEVVRGLDALLDDVGVFVAEFPYVADLVEHVEYDTIYHEHLSYFGLRPLTHLFHRADFELIDAEHHRIHGGSVRLFVARKGRYPRTRRLEELLAKEEQGRLGEVGTYVRFRERVADSRSALIELLDTERAAGRHLAALGATAKSTTLLNYCGVGRERLEWIADSTPMKIGLFSPGTHIPIRAESSITDERPDVVLLLAWNYADAILRRFEDFVREGGRFIHPIPIAKLLP